MLQCKIFIKIFIDIYKHIHTYTHIVLFWKLWKKHWKNAFPILMRWVKLEPIIQSEVSQKEKHQYSIIFILWQHYLACGILVPDQGSNLCPLQWKHGVLITGPSGRSPQPGYLHGFCQSCSDFPSFTCTYLCVCVCVCF